MLSNTYEKKFNLLLKYIKKSLYLTEELYNLINTREDTNLDIFDKNLFNLNIIHNDLKRILQKSKLINLNPNYIANIINRKIIEFDEYNLYKQTNKIEEVAYVDLSNTIEDIFKKND